MKKIYIGLVFMVYGITVAMEEEEQMAAVGATGNEYMMVEKGTLTLKNATNTPLVFSVGKNVTYKPHESRKLFVTNRKLAPNQEIEIPVMLSKADNYMVKLYLFDTSGKEVRKDVVELNKSTKSVSLLLYSEGFTPIALEQKLKSIPGL